MIPWPQYTFHYSRTTHQLLYSRDTVRQFYCYKVQQFRECLRMILPIYLWQFHGYPLTIMRVSCESSDFLKSFHCFRPSVCRICTIGDICFPPFYKATKHFQQLRSKGEDIALLLHHSNFTLHRLYRSQLLPFHWPLTTLVANVNRYTCQPCVTKSFGLKDLVEYSAQSIPQSISVCMVCAE